MVWYGLAGVSYVGLSIFHKFLLNWLIGPLWVEHIGYPLDLSWTDPWWIGSRSLPHVSPWLVPLGVGVLLALVYLVASRLWEPMGQAEAAARARRA